MRISDWSSDVCSSDLRDALPEAQTIDVYFHEWIKNPDTILREIYKRADLPLTDQTLGELHAYLAAHETAKQGKIVYNLERDFSLTADDIRKHFDFYFERFPVQMEVK